MIVQRSFSFTARAAKAWSQPEFAERARVSRDSIIAIERQVRSFAAARPGSAPFGLSVEGVFDKTDV